MDVHKDGKGFMVRGDEPFRIEVDALPGGKGVVAHVYRGYIDDSEQDPDLVYNDDNPENVSLLSPEEGITVAKLGDY